ncbi:hypothetical protein Tco_1408828 [Tanacetum coccineum]
MLKKLLAFSLPPPLNLLNMLNNLLKFLKMFLPHLFNVLNKSRSSSNMINFVFVNAMFDHEASMASVETISDDRDEKEVVDMSGWSTEERRNDKQRRSIKMPNAQKVTIESLARNNRIEEFPYKMGYLNVL